MSKLSCLKAYDLRGKVPEDLDENLAWALGRAYATFVQPRRVVVGYDVRLSSPGLACALIQGLQESGVDVFVLGQCGTEEVYFAVFDQALDGGIMVTASHNPKEYNGMKFVREDARPLSADTGLDVLAALAMEKNFSPSKPLGKEIPLDIRKRYRDHLLNMIDKSLLRPLKIVANPGNGGAGKVLEVLRAELPFEFELLLEDPDGNFPYGVPNPLLAENRALTAQAVRAHQADLGIAWDGDFDRCFFFDAAGRFVESSYLVGLLGQCFCRKEPGARIVHDPRLIWNTQAMVQDAGGQAVLSRGGHTFMKDTMRRVDALYGGEMSAHHYFRDFAYCDSGMLPWLLITELLCTSGKTLAQLVDAALAAYPASGEINRKVADPASCLLRVEEHFAGQYAKRDTTDGLSLEFIDWRFNLRSSNTEPVIRLNVESRGNPELLRAKTAELLDLLDE